MSFFKSFFKPKNIVENGKERFSEEGKSFVVNEEDDLCKCGYCNRYVPCEELIDIEQDSFCQECFDNGHGFRECVGCGQFFRIYEEYFREDDEYDDEHEDENEDQDDVNEEEVFVCEFCEDADIPDYDYNGNADWWRDDSYNGD